MMEFEQWLNVHYAQLWYLVYAGSLFFFLLIENLIPLRDYVCPVIKRFATNMGLLVINAGMQRFILPILPITAAIYFQDNPLVVFNLFELSMPTKFILAILIWDLFGYIFHLTMHKFPLLWRIHYPHHIDMDFDATTNLRFHPFETLFTTCTEMLLIIIFGIPVIIVMLMNIIHIVNGFFTHWNIPFPGKIDRILKTVFITPNMHRIHHSAKIDEGMRNFGIIFSFWDRIFRTYLANPAEKAQSMAIGLPRHRNPQANMLLAFLYLPFRKP